MSKLNLPLVFVLVFAILVSATVAVAVGLGFVLNWLVPSIGLSTSLTVIMGTIVFWGFLVFAFTLSTIVMSAQRQAMADNSDDDDEEDEEGGTDEILAMHADLVADRLLAGLSDRMNFTRRRRQH